MARRKGPLSKLWEAVKKFFCIGSIDSDESARKSVTRLRDIDLPTCLQRKVIMQIIVSLGAFIVTIALIITYKTPQCFIGFAVTGYGAYSVICLLLDYRNGDIEESCLLCASVSANIIGKTTRVIFRTNDDTPEYYEFILPGRRRKDYVPNLSYVVYFNKNRPKNLIASLQI